MQKQRRDSFTLIELLIVMVVIGILAGIIFRLARVAGKSEEKARTIEVLTRVAGALEEFKSEYGIYPPIKPNVCTCHGWDCRICYQYENTNMSHMTEWVNRNYFTDPAHADELNFEYGLVAFLDDRERGSMNPAHLNNPDNSDNAWIGDEQRDERAKGRWNRFMSGVISGGGSASHRTGEGHSFSNSVDTIYDGWGNIIRYECDPPHLSYELWSLGRDGANGTEDDIHRDSM